jgi:hypothetical protein
VGLVNCVRGLLKCTGETVPAADPRYFARKCRAELTDSVLSSVEPMLVLLETCEAQVKALEKMIEALI